MDNIIETPLHYIIIIIVSKIIPFLALYSFFSIENMYLCFAEIRRYDSARCIGEILVRFSGCVGLGHFCNPAISFHISDHLRMDSHRQLGFIYFCGLPAHICCSNDPNWFLFPPRIDQLPKFRLYIWHGAPQFTFTTSTGWMYIETIHKKKQHSE